MSSLRSFALVGSVAAGLLAAGLCRGGAAEPAGPPEYARSILNHREEKDRFFRTGAKSPVPPEQKSAMRPLDYYPVDPAWRLRLPFVKYKEPETIVLITSVGEKRPMRRLGHVEFERDGVRARLQIYRPVETTREEDSLWAPFIDAEAGHETYPAGRYIDAELLADGTVLLDFNRAYNPYCAYGWHKYSCPITPRENRLPIAVRAGEKGFHH